MVALKTMSFLIITCRKTTLLIIIFENQTKNKKEDLSVLLLYDLVLLTVVCLVEATGIEPVSKMPTK